MKNESNLNLKSSVVQKLYNQYVLYISSTYSCLYGKIIFELCVSVHVFTYSPYCSYCRESESSLSYHWCQLSSYFM